MWHPDLPLVCFRECFEPSVSYRRYAPFWGYLSGAAKQLWEHSFFSGAGGVCVGCLGKTVLCYLWDPLGHYSLWPLYLQLSLPAGPFYLSLSILSPPPNPFLSLDPITSKDRVPHHWPFTFNTRSMQVLEPAPPFCLSTLPPHLTYTSQVLLSLLSYLCFKNKLHGQDCKAPWKNPPRRSERKDSVPKLDCSCPAPSPVAKESQVAVRGGPSNPPHRFVELDPEPPSALMGPPANRVHSTQYTQRWPSA